MSDTAVMEQLPIVTSNDGVMLVSGTRVTLDTIIAAFEDGATAEEIAQQYPSVRLADVYQVIGYYLRHAGELQSYFKKRFRTSARIKAMNEARWLAAGIRERLRARNQG